MIYKYKKTQKLSLLIILFSLLTLPSISQATVWTVCAPAGCNFVTIQDAINNALAGDTIDISSGNYSEQVTIDKALTLNGAGATTTSVYFGAGSIVTVNDGVIATINDIKIYGSFGADEGGGIHNSGELTVNRAIIENNFAFVEGGGIWTDGTLTLNEVTISGNAVELGNLPGGNGGGIYIDYKDSSQVSTSVNIINSNIDNNQACNGGGIFNKVGNLTLLRTSVTNNQAGIIGLSSACPALWQTMINGGGIFNLGTQVGTLVGKVQIKKSTISGNSAARYGAGLANVYGGKMTLTNTTLSGNTAENGGGALYIYDIAIFPASTLVLNNTTITNNSSTWGAGGVYSRDLATTSVTSRNSIIAEQAAGDDCAFSLGSFITAGYNLESSTSCAFNDILNGDIQNSSPGLLPLVNNGGLTETHALPVGSTAIDAGNPTGCLADMNANGIANITLTKDQRDNTRLANICDIGAFEL